MSIQARIEQVLAGRLTYDVLSVEEQAVVRDVWDDRIASRISALDFGREPATDPGCPGPSQAQTATPSSTTPLGMLPGRTDGNDGCAADAGRTS